MAPHQELVQGWKMFCADRWEITPTFPVERGVCQGSILLPTLFNIVVDPLLRRLVDAGLGLSVNNLDGGAYLHADDIRTIATSMYTLQAKISELFKFASTHFLYLNPSKCDSLFCTTQQCSFPSL